MMKEIQRLIWVLAIGLVANTASAQGDFNSILYDLNRHIDRNQWDEVILKASDLLIEDPLRGDGYYYTAFAFFKMEQPETANEYLAKAELMADDDLETKISALRKDIQTLKSQQQIIGNIKKLEKENKTEAQAEEWKKAWELDKSKVEYALNAVELYIKLKKYPSALEILRDPTLSADKEAKALIDRLNQTGQMKSVNGYAESMRLGGVYMTQENYSAAYQKFDEALGFKSGDEKAKEMRSIAADENAWKTAKATNTVSSYESYANGQTLRKYSSDAHTKIKRLLMNAGEAAANSDNVANMESNLDYYLNKYPRGEDVNKALKIKCDTYYRVGNKFTYEKSTWSQTLAKEHFEKAQKVCTDKPDLAKKIKKANRLIKRYGRDDRFYVAYVYDSITKYGISWGTINNRSVGMYATFRFNGESWNNYMDTESGAEVGNDSLVYGGQYVNWGNDWRFRDSIRTGTMEGLLGITKKITYPLWIYAGAGIAYNSVAWKMDIYDNLGDYYTTSWVKNGEASKVRAAYEFGGIIDLTGFHIRGGMKAQGLFSEVTYTLGVGLSFIRD